MKRAVICFTRVPKPGTTKTRLLGILTPEQCARLHIAFLKDLARVYGRTEADLFISHTDDPDWPMLRQIFPDARGFFPQVGDTLGDKMYQAISRVLALGYDSVILTGTDLPQMTTGHLHSGFAALERADVAIGATPDGGYYLIGMKMPHGEIFRVPNYGTATVYENTVAAIRAAGLSVQAADTCGDVDTPEDLRALANSVDPGSETGRCLRQFRKEGVSL